MLIGTHGDLVDKRAVSDEEIKQCADSLKLPFFVTSAVDGKNVSEAFQELARIVLSKTKQHDSTIASMCLYGVSAIS